LERLRGDGFAGATVVHGSAGLIESTDLPFVIEVVDDQTQIDRLFPILDEMITGALVTMERVRVLKYAAEATTTRPVTE
jgi:uncharacterized protein